MPVEKGQRLKLLKIWEILRQETDKDHTLTTVDLLERLEGIGIKCDRRTLYADIKALNDNGYKVNCVRRMANEYYVEKREFSLAEIHILMDAVQAASFITEQKTAQLVDKIAELAGSRRAEAIKQNVVAFNTVKSQNEKFSFTNKRGGERNDVCFFHVRFARQTTGYSRIIANRRRGFKHIARKIRADTTTTVVLNLSVLLHIGEVSLHRGLGDTRTRRDVAHRRRLAILHKIFVYKLAYRLRPLGTPLIHKCLQITQGTIVPCSHYSIRKKVCQ